MSVLETIPRSSEWTLARIDLKAEAKVRKVLRGLCAEVDAAYAATWIRMGRTSEPAVEVLALAGEPALAPVEFPFATAMPSFEIVVDAGGTEHVAVVAAITIGRRMPAAALIVLPGARGPEVLAAAETAATSIEDILVDALA